MFSSVMEDLVNFNLTLIKEIYLKKQIYLSYRKKSIIIL